MNALLVYPQFPDTFWSFKHVLRFVAKKAAFPPLGLLTVAAMLHPSVPMLHSRTLAATNPPRGPATRPVTWPSRKVARSATSSGPSTR